MEHNRQTSNWFNAQAYLNSNCNANKPGNVNPEFRANEPGCGCTFSYNGGAGAGTAVCCDSPRPYEAGFNDKKRDPTCCCESSRCYQRPVVNRKQQEAAASCKPECTDTFKYVPEFNYPPPPCPPANGAGCHNKLGSEQGGCGCAETYQGGLTNKKPDGVLDEVVCCCGPDTYESITNTDAQRYKGKGPDRRTFYADDNCCPCQKSNNASTNNNLFDGETDWCEIRKVAYGAVDNCASCSPKLPRRSPSFYCEEENYVKNMSLDVTKGR